MKLELVHVVQWKLQHDGCDSPSFGRKKAETYATSLSPNLFFDTSLQANGRQRIQSKRSSDVSDADGERIQEHSSSGVTSESVQSSKVAAAVLRSSSSN